MKLRFKIDEAAEALSVSRSQVEKLLADGKLSAHNDGPGGDRYISIRALTEYIESRESIGVESRRQRFA